MKRDITVILLCFVAAAGGANVTPLLTGSGKIEFPENAIRAYLQASSGALTVAAGGTNQNVIVVPTGTGSMALGSSNAPTFKNTSGALTIAAAGSNKSITMTPSGTGSLVWSGNALAAAKLGLEGVTDFSGTGCNGSLCVGNGGTINLDDTAIVAWGGASTRPQIAGSKAAATMDFRNATNGYTFNGGKVGIGAAPTTYALEVTGDINTSTGFRAGGTAGATQLLTVRNSAGAGTCQITVVGGIITASTC